MQKTLSIFLLYVTEQAGNIFLFKISKFLIIYLSNNSFGNILLISSIFNSPKFWINIGFPSFVIEWKLWG